MNAEQCPLCFSLMEVREVAPCMDCGHHEVELQHFAEGVHTYAEYRIFGELTLVLCNFCRADFASYDPEYFGVHASRRIGWNRMFLMRDVVPPQRGFDKVCPECCRRLSFVQFVVDARELHGAGTG